jgi:hypothetical protein
MAYLDEKPIAQGEIEFFAVTPDHFDGADVTPMVVKDGMYVLAHSESGNDHVMLAERGSVGVVKTDTAAMTILRVMVEHPDTEVVNLSPTGHQNLALAPRLYEARISREMGMDDVIRRSID